MTDVEHLNDALQALAIHLESLHALMSEIAYSQAAMVRLLIEVRPDLFDRYQVLRADSATLSPAAAQLRQVADSIAGLRRLLEQEKP